jgi:hypothetical protein
MSITRFIPLLSLIRVDPENQDLANLVQSNSWHHYRYFTARCRMTNVATSKDFWSRTRDDKLGFVVSEIGIYTDMAKCMMALLQEVHVPAARLFES